MSAHKRKIAIALAVAGASPLPLAWLHKFYVGQYLWGITYLMLGWTGIPHIACCFEGLWYFSQSDEGFSRRFPKAGSILEPVESQPLTVETTATKLPTVDLSNLNAVAVRLQSKVAGWVNQVSTGEDAAETPPSTAGDTASQVATALRELDQLRKEGLITEYEFEQKRRKLIEQV